MEQALKTAKDAGYKDIIAEEFGSLLEAMNKVKSEFIDGKADADPIIYKIWDQGGQGVRCRMLTLIPIHSSCHDAIISARLLTFDNHATLDS